MPPARLTPPRPPAAALLAAILRRIAGGRLSDLPFDVELWDGSVLPASAPDGAASIGRLRVGRRALGHLVREPNQLGLTRAYASGDLAFDGDLSAILAERARFRSVRPSTRDLALGAAALLLAAGPGALRSPPVPASEARPRGRRHSRTRDRAAVRHHYDVSNAFYRRLLGPSLVYSCAYFASPDDALEAAQERKLELICRKLRLVEGERLLDIGCGWGSLIMHAARHHGAQAVGITLSGEQAALARRRVRDAGLSDLVEVRVADYREVADGPYDKVASVGMVEHVGAAQLAEYSATIARLLRPGGLMLNHGIARLFSQPAGEKSLIQRYVFPDGELAPLADVIASLQEAGLEARDVESLREQYVLTLRRWLANLHAARDPMAADAGEERVRIWELYMAGSALAFEDGDISVFQVLAARPGGPHGLPLVREAAAAAAATTADGIALSGTHVE
jgi:cyclopropane-fatty-acyl-phospholipid synthase